MKKMWCILVLAAACCADSALAFTLKPPRFVLNRSLFLTWDIGSSSGFQSYEVFASTNATFALTTANRVATRSNYELCYTKIMGLKPETTYYFQVRRNASTGATTSTVVSATTIKDGTDTTIPSVMYHHVMPRARFATGFDPGGWISTENFSRDLAHLKRCGVNPIGVEELVARMKNGTPLPPNPVFLTFDDGYWDFLEYGLPILVSNDFQAVNAIVTQMAGGTSTWAVPEWPLDRLMTWAQIKECQRAGMRMGAHTQTHVDLYKEPSKKSQIAGSRTDLLNALHEEPLYFCYPWGMSGHEYRDMIGEVERVGFTLATKTWAPALGTVNSDRFWFPRVFANQDDTLRDFLVKLNIDSDKDGFKDFEELDRGTDPAKWDTDGDGLSDYQEVHTYKTNPLKADTDGDGLSDGAEVLTYKTNPLKTDTDGDGLSDGVEVLTHGTDPLKADTDGDGIPDKLEVDAGLNPLVHNGRLPFFARAADYPAAGVQVPGRIEAERFDYGGPGLAYSDTTVANQGGAFRPFEQVDISSESTAQSGYILGWTPANEWVTYTVVAPADGYYRARLRVAAKGAGGRMRLEVNNQDVSGSLVIPDTGAWNAWTNIQSGNFFMSAGTNVLKLVMVQNGSGAVAGNVDYIQISKHAAPGAYKGTPPTLPGTVQFEDFDEGGPGTAYYDTTVTDQGGTSYRTDESVDVAADSLADNGYVVGWAVTGEWMEYTVNVAQAGTYDLSVRLATKYAGGTFRMRFGGVDKTGTWTVPNTGSWSTYQILTKRGIVLTAGVQKVRIEIIDSQGKTGMANLDWFQLAPPPVPGPYGGTAAALPGTVQFEHFDIGGPSMAYVDTTEEDLGGTGYRLDESVDVASDSQAGNGYVVGWAVTGEWMEYTVNVAQAGTYDLSVRLASKYAGGTFRMRFGGVDKTGAWVVPNTGSWSTYQILTKRGIALTAGVQKVRIEIIDSQGKTGMANLDWFRVTPTPVPGPYGGTAAALPGTVQFEHFDEGGQGVAYSDTTTDDLGGTGYRLEEAVDVAADSLADNGYVVGWAVTSEWMEYTVNVATAGTYNLSVRLASKYAGGTFRVRFGGADKTGAWVVPNTGSWSTYQILTKRGIVLTAGVQKVRVEVIDSQGKAGVANLDWFRVTPTPVSGPYGGTAPPLPGTVQFEHFDEGGADTAYSDTTAEDLGNTGYRPGEAVDIAADSQAGNGYVVGWAVTGEWMEYTVNVPTAGAYDLSVRLASKYAGGTFRMSFNGVDKTGAWTVPDTGSWSTFQTLTKRGIMLEAGIQKVCVEVIDSQGKSGVANLDWFQIATPAPRAPYKGTAWAIPGTIEFEDFDEGGQSVAYSDTTTGNAGNAYRTAESVDIAALSTAGNGHVVGWTAAGEWLEYTVNVAYAGTYNISILASQTAVGGRISLTMNGVLKASSIIVPNTGSWNTYQTITLSGIVLEAGQQTLRITMATVAPNGYVGNFDKITFGRVGTLAKSLAQPVEDGESAALLQPVPVDVLTDDEALQPGIGWLTVDGDFSTLWKSRNDTGGWVTLVYDQPIEASSIQLIYDDETNVPRILYSLDAEEWSAWDAVEDRPISLHYLWLLFDAPAPAIHEIIIE